jgi:hypothetical protein
MPVVSQSRAQKMLLYALALLILKVTATVVLGYRDYMPPNFAADFLQGREAVLILVHDCCVDRVREPASRHLILAERRFGCWSLVACATSVT